MKKFLYVAFALFIVLFLVSLPVLAQTSGVSNETSSVFVKAIAIAGLVSAIVQGVKKLFPNAHGVLFIVLNVVGNAAGYIAVANPSDMQTFGFWGALITMIFASAGVHDLAGFIGLFKTKSQLQSGS